MRVHGYARGDRKEGITKVMSYAYYSRTRLEAWISEGTEHAVQVKDQSQRKH